MMTVYLSEQRLGALMIEDALVAALGRENVENRYAANVVDDLRRRGEDELADSLIAELEQYNEELQRTEATQRDQREERARAAHMTRTYGKPKEI